ncbi:MAG: hypothetical protein MUP99_11275 [Pedobacter sp.]|nr:hypothetical protein [Pedobacter sp.]
MNFKTVFNYKQSKMWGLGVLALLLLFVTNTGDFKTAVPVERSQRTDILSWSFYNAKVLFQGNDFLRETSSSLAPKVKSYRKKFKHLVEGNDDHSPYVKELQYTRYLRSAVPLNYESPYFISEQQSCLYRLSVF